MKKILVADDEVDVVEMVSGMLRGKGFEVVAAYDGSEAVEMAQLHKPDLVLLDIQMPASFGLSVLNELKSSPETANIPVIVVSGFGSDEIIRAANEAGAQDFLPKPFSSKGLLSKIHDNLMDRE